MPPLLRGRSACLLLPWGADVRAFPYLLRRSVPGYSIVCAMSAEAAGRLVSFGTSRESGNSREVASCW